MLITLPQGPDYKVPNLLDLGNPFVALMDPEAVIRRMERSEELKRLRKRVLRPLDRPWIPHKVSAEVAASDAAPV